MKSSISKKVQECLDNLQELPPIIIRHYKGTKKETWEITQGNMLWQFDKQSDAEQFCFQASCVVADREIKKWNEALIKVGM